MKRPAAVVLLSGGLDSTTVLAIAKSQGFDCYALSFRYGQRHIHELKAAETVAAAQGVAPPDAPAATTPETSTEILDIRTARAKGLQERAVLLRHALRNAAVPIVTVVGIGVALLIGGVVVTETVFAIPGLGSLTVDAVLNRDFPVIQGLVLLFSVSYVLINLLVDSSYVWLDPRIRH